MEIVRIDSILLVTANSYKVLNGTVLEITPAAMHTTQYLYFRESLLVRSCISGKQAFSQCGEFIFQVFLLLVFENLLVSYIYLIYFSLILSFLFLELFFFFFLCYLFVLFSFSFKPVFFLYLKGVFAKNESWYKSDGIKFSIDRF